MKSKQCTQMQNQSYQVPVQKTTTKMVSVTKKVPKTIYVDVTTQVPKQCTQTVMETLQKTKTAMQSRTKTVYDTQVRTKCEPKVTYVTKEIPVYNVVARPAQPCGGAGGGAMGG